MAKKKTGQTNYPPSDKEIGRKVTHMMISPLHDIEEDWAFHDYTVGDVQDQCEFWDLVHRAVPEMQGTCKIARVTIIYEEL